ncbi:MAG: WYL domain-containing protein [Synergistaceae bacterium]|nr:WYL domain-containing protein [Synergistaceae bacterium]
MKMEATEKLERVLDIYTKLRGGGTVNKAAEAERYGVSARSVQRDIDEIRGYLANNAENNGYLDVVYDAGEKGFRLQSKTKLNFDGAETLAIAKILLDSRALSKTAMAEIIDKIIDSCYPKDRATVKDMLKNEIYHYAEPRHGDEFMSKMWDIAKALKDKCYLDIKYLRPKDGKIVKRRLLPAAIMFSEYYFYLTAFIQDKKVQETFDVINDAFPTIYRIDRILSLKISKEKYSVPYKDRFQEGEFRKRVQFMYGGKLQKVRFTYTGDYIDAVLDRLPTAKILQQEGKRSVVQAEVFGKGIEMWLRSQGDLISDVQYELCTAKKN